MKTLLTLSALIISIFLQAQLKTSKVCPAIYVDILDGKVNGLETDFTQGQIKKALPCFTTAEEENSSSKCGGLIAYKDKDVYFYTGRDYVEIRDKFKGKLSIPLMGAVLNALFKWLGHPKIKDISWDAYQTQYGTLVLYFNKANRINRILFSKKSTDTMTLCE
jgi:hypothetical protein